MHPIIHLRNLFHSVLKRSFAGRVIKQAISRPATGAIHLVCATRRSEQEFWSDSALGRSLLPCRNDPQLHIHVHYENKLGLPSIYNPHLSNAPSDSLLLLIHDDVWLDTPDWMDRLRKGLGHYDILGVAGNTRLGSTQPAWLFRTIEDGRFVWDTGYLSGEVAHGHRSHGKVQRYGPVPLACKVLDGVFIGMRCRNIKRAKVEFDEIFQFHFYDMDFCRRACDTGLTIGTWPIPITHQSLGAFGGPDWQENFNKYLKKWNSE